MLSSYVVSAARCALTDAQAQQTGTEEVISYTTRGVCRCFIFCRPRRSMIVLLRDLPLVRCPVSLPHPYPHQYMEHHELALGGSAKPTA